MARSLRGPCFFAFGGAWRRGMRIATGALRPRNDRGFTRGAACGGVGAPRLTEGNKRCGGAGRCGERTERCQWQKQRSERVAAVKISSVRRKAAQKFWAPQQGHRPLRKRILWCVGEGLCPSRGRPQGSPLRRVTRGAMGGRPQGSPLRKRYMGCGVRAVGDAGPYERVSCGA